MSQLQRDWSQVKEQELNAGFVSAGEHPAACELRPGLPLPHHRVLLENAERMRHRLRRHRHRAARLPDRRLVAEQTQVADEWHL